MKKLVIFICLILISGVLRSQDTSIVKYLPLKVGNTWIYQWGSGSQKVRKTGTVLSAGHLYYNLAVTGPACTPCPASIPNPFLVTIGSFRIDSLSGNVLILGNSCPWYNGEGLLDSLKRKVGDNLQNACNSNQCLDTNVQLVFGTMRKTRKFGLSIPNWSQIRTYAKDIGLLSSTQGCSSAGSCIYILRGCVIDGVVYGDTTFPVGINQISSEVPKEFSLSQNYPNPFNPMTKVKFQMTKSGFAVLTVFDVLGKEIQVLVNQQLSQGTYEVDFDGSDLPSGVYYYRLDASASLSITYTETRKMVLIK